MVHCLSSVVRWIQWICSCSWNNRCFYWSSITDLDSRFCYKISRTMLYVNFNENMSIAPSWSGFTKNCFQLVSCIGCPIVLHFALVKVGALSENILSFHFGDFERKRQWWRSYLDSSMWITWKKWVPSLFVLDLQKNQNKSNSTIHDCFVDRILRCPKAHNL